MQIYPQTGSAAAKRAEKAEERAPQTRTRRQRERERGRQRVASSGKPRRALSALADGHLMYPQELRAKLGYYLCQARSHGKYFRANEKMATLLF